jgi:hypothetical protein
MAYDAKRERVVLFGGAYDYHGDLGPVDDTWEWNGTTWSLRAFTPSQRPPARAHHRMAYDAARTRIVLHGGIGEFSGGVASQLYGDTWEWDGGSTWVQRSTSSGPATRFQHGLAYDAKRERVMLFGGTTSYGSGGRNVAADTWEWNGTAWTARSFGGPPPRDGHALVYDPGTRELVLFGGIRRDDYNGHTLLGDTWRWNDSASAWMVVATPNVPAERHGHAGVYDGARQQIVIAGGIGALGDLDDTWQFVTRFQGAPPVVDDDCSGATDLDGDGLRGCADPDCWSWCTPACPPGTSCPIAPRCGDGMCQTPRETSARCPADCDPQPPMCGDGACGASETVVGCALDCATCGDLQCSATESTATCAVDCP